MHFKPVAQNVLEWIAIKAGMVPLPLGYSHFGFIMSKVVLEAADKGVFEAMSKEKQSLRELAIATNLHEKALESLVIVLASMGLVRQAGERFSLTPASKKWLLKDSRHSMYWLLMFDNRVCFKWMDEVGPFLQSGKGLQYHQTFNGEEWYYYQKAMAVSAAATAKEAVRKIPLPLNATKMLDIGGSHGRYSAELCKKNPNLSAVVLDLPEAVAVSEPLFQDHELKQRVRFQPGNILEFDIGADQYDLVLLASVAHHLTEEENMLVAEKAFRALKPGGYFCIIEIIRREQAKLNSDLLGSLANFFFALSSTSGAWRLNDIKQWQRQAGFIKPSKSTFLTIPGYAAITAQKPASARV
ncbi:methyltransferase domain-containing protein [Segetibacter sp. 3557_3]|uniref:class I SAM-dependent methyltransferase n=1 Tax=Segetibacter sp. 3557_3 TaxID=2547429 RepID=UPI0010587C4F|nr:class I SAM-dependent methyltransferase [Segetibacter sp. 3557_3]TDH27733.1 methyltransferase domain-containing protein [Segetibacter sp. 3557_3]